MSKHAFYAYSNTAQLYLVKKNVFSTLLHINAQKPRQKTRKHISMNPDQSHTVDEVERWSKPHATRSEKGKTLMLVLNVG